MTSTVQIKPDQTAEVNVGIYSGWLPVFAPVEIRVFEGGKLIGTSVDGRLMMKPGTHTLQMVNPSLGIEQSRQVEITPGEDAEVAVHREHVVVGLEDGDDAGRDRLLADAGEPLREPALAQQDQHLLLDHPGQQQRAVEVPERLGRETFDEAVGGGGSAGLGEEVDEASVGGLATPPPAPEEPAEDNGGGSDSEESGGIG